MTTAGRPRVLVPGGGGYVGGLTLPLLKSSYAFRVLDPTRPADAELDWVEGSVLDLACLAAACEGMDAMLYMAMGAKHLRGIEAVASSHDGSVKGLHLALLAAAEAGVRRAVYLSSLSVYDGHRSLTDGSTDGEDVPPAPRSAYGFTKWLGEEVCRFVNRAHGLPVVALRLFSPVSVEDWHAHRRDGRVTTHTSAPDVARAIAGALEYDGAGFEIVHVTGDRSGRAYRHEKARRLLGWEPLEGG